MDEEYDYSEMTDDEFDNILEELLDEYPASHWVQVIPGMYEQAREYLNNEVLDMWKKNH
jgi:hypothetical protein